ARRAGGQAVRHRAGGGSGPAVGCPERPALDRCWDDPSAAGRAAQARARRVAAQGGRAGKGQRRALGPAPGPGPVPHYENEADVPSIGTRTSRGTSARAASAVTAGQRDADAGPKLPCLRDPGRQLKAWQAAVEWLREHNLPAPAPEFAAAWLRC